MEKRNACKKRKLKKRLRVWAILPCLLAVVSLFLAFYSITGCVFVSERGEIRETPGANNQATVYLLPTATVDRWFSLMLVTPYPWSTPLPPDESTPLDGTYAKLDPDEPQWWHCRRCADFLPAGGIWRLNLANGIYRIYYEVTQWRSLGSFSISGNQIYFFNDPNCMQDIGTYHWLLSEGELELGLIQDECAIGMRAANFSKQPWLSCQPPGLEAAISDHWLKPPGCVE